MEFAAPQVTADDHVRGPADAPVTILEYGDYECPYCRGAFRDVHLLLDRYPDTVRFVFRNFPIAQLHPHAEQAAEAAEAAGAQGKFWPMYERLLRPSSRLDLDSLLDCAADLSLDVGRFRDDVNATPKFYVDGERIDGKLPLEGVEDAIRAAARAASAD